MSGHTLSVLCILLVATLVFALDDDPVELCHQIRNGTKRILAVSPIFAQKKFLLLTTDYILLIVQNDTLFLWDLHRPKNLELNLGDATLIHLNSVKSLAMPDDHVFFFNGSFIKSSESLKKEEDTYLGLLSSHWIIITVAPLVNVTSVKPYRLRINPHYHPTKMVFSDVGFYFDHEPQYPLLGQPVFADKKLYEASLYLNGSEIWLARNVSYTRTYFLGDSTPSDVGYSVRGFYLLGFNYQTATVTWQPMSSIPSSQLEPPLSVSFDQFFRCQRSITTTPLTTTPSTTTAATILSTETKTEADTDTDTETDTELVPPRKSIDPLDNGWVIFAMFADTAVLVVGLVIATILYRYHIGTNLTRRLQAPTGIWEGQLKIDPVLGYPKVAGALEEVAVKTSSAGPKKSSKA